MKKLFALLLLGSIVPVGASAQYQLSNSGFEDWEDISEISYQNKAGEEPVYWSSFLTGTGSTLYLTFAAYNQLEKSTDAHAGDASAMIYARKVLGSNVAQGNLTTGCINMGSMTASDGSGNYNYTNLDVEGQNMAFTGLPDEMHVWLKVQVTDYTAKATALLHTEGYYQDPYANEEKITATLVATAADTEIASTDGEWTEFTIPFVYENGAETRPAYALVSFATSSTPGAGTGYDSDALTGDVMWIDDVTMVYFSELASLSYDGESIFSEGTTAYDLSSVEYDAEKLEATANGIGATVETSFDEESALLTITVKGDNISEDAENYHTYTIQFKAAQKETTEYEGYLNISMMGGDVTVNSPATVEITDNGDGTCDFLLPDLTLEDIGTLGDIELKGVTVTADESGTSTYSGYEEGMQLLYGAIVADVTLNGTITSQGVVKMEISVVWNVDSDTTLPVEVSFTSYMITEPVTTEYDGYLNISVMGSPIVTDSQATVEITDNGDGTCDFLLPDLSLEDLGTLGDIELKGVTVTADESGTSSYSGYEEGMQLLEGAIVADVTLTGTITSDGIVSMTISVVWKVDSDTTMPVEVTFTTDSQGGISTVVASEDGDGLVDVYTVLGVKVLSGVTVEEATATLAKGIYIMGNKKILVK